MCQTKVVRYEQKRALVGTVRRTAMLGGCPACLGHTATLQALDVGAMGRQQPEGKECSEAAEQGSPALRCFRDRGWKPI